MSLLLHAATQGSHLDRHWLLHVCLLQSVSNICTQVCFELVCYFFVSRENKGSLEEFCQHSRFLLSVIYFSFFFLSLIESSAVFFQGSYSFPLTPTTPSLPSFLLYHLPKASSSNCRFWKAFSYYLLWVAVLSSLILREIRHALSSPITHSSSSRNIA